MLTYEMIYCMTWALPLKGELHDPESRVGVESCIAWNTLMDLT